jgi:hypothetical protein
MRIDRVCKCEIYGDAWSPSKPDGFRPAKARTFPPPMPPHVLMKFRGFPPGCGGSVADFCGWDAHEARLRCPDDVSGDMHEDEISGGALSPNLLTTQTMVTTGIFPCKEKFPW